MKNLMFSIMLFFTTASFAQDACTASITKLTGEAFLKRVELKRVHKIDLDKDCKYKVISFTLEFTDTKKGYHKYDIPGNEIPEKAYNAMQLTDKKISVTNILIGTGKKGDPTMTLPDIFLTLTK